MQQQPPKSPKELGVSRPGDRDSLVESLKMGWKAQFGNEKAKVDQGGKLESPPSTVVESSPQGAYIYGDGNEVSVGDLIESQGVLAEVKTIASNGIVLDVPAQGVKVVQGQDLLFYKKLGKRGG